LNKLKYCLVVVGTLLLTACAPYGVEGNPHNTSTTEQNSDDQTDESLANLKTFPITIGEFERHVQKNDVSKFLSETETGYETGKQIMIIEYKNNRSKENDKLGNINILINQPGKKLSEIEDDVLRLFEILFTSMNVSYEPEKLMTNIKANQINLLSSEEMALELTNYVDDIQLIIEPK